MKLRLISTTVIATGLVFMACQNAAGPNQSGVPQFDPPDLSFAAKLNIAPPILVEDAKAIAAEAAGGTALTVTLEQEGGVDVFEIIVDTTSGRMEVEVRASDGAVLEIEKDDGN